MVKRRVLCLVLTISVLVGIFALSCGSKTPESTQSQTTTQAAGKVYELTISTTGPLTDPYNEVTAAWGKWLYKQSNGQIKLTIIPNNQACKVTDDYEATVSGIVDMGFQMIGFTPGRFPLNEVGGLSGVFDTWAAKRGSMAQMALNEKYPEFQAEFPDAKLIFFTRNVSYHYFTTKKALKGPEDLKGLMQIEIGPANSEMLKYFGGSPQNVAMEDSYDSMAKGVVDGHTVGYSAVDQFYPDILNYGMEIGIQDTPWLIAMNLNTWKSLPPDLQKLFEGENAKRLASVMGSVWDEAGQQYKNNVVARWKAKGLPGPTILTDAQKSKWVEAAKPIQEEWVKSVTPKVGEAKARAILADWFAFSKQYLYTGVSQEDQKILNEWKALPSY
jgi:TRAP-type transport system periplasmic protein